MLHFVKINSLMKMLCSYDDDVLSARVLSLVPVERLLQTASSQLRKAQKIARAKRQNLEEAILFETFFLIALLTWFKQEFFQWFDQPFCDNCRVKCRVLTRISGSDEEYYIDQIEVYECPSCSKRYFFNRYNDVTVLLQTRKGRCSEYAQVFTAICRSLGFDSRFIFDITDHAWTEVYSNLQKRWLHCDPSEGLLDKPLIYELGWKKSLSYIVGVTSYDIQDVTWRYSSHHAQVTARRAPHIDKELISHMETARNQLQKGFSRRRKEHVLKRLICEWIELMTEPSTSEVYGGRSSGSEQWRTQRGEYTESPSNFFIFQSSKIKFNTNTLCMWYSANADAYIIHELNKDTIIKGWNMCTYMHRNIMRKEEHDWKMSYLAREKSNEDGCISWKFDTSDSDLVIDSVHVMTNFFSTATGMVKCNLYSESKSVLYTNERKFETTAFKNEKTLTVEILLSGGEGENGWQHSQICRQSMEEGSSVCFGVVLILKKLK